ncbi:Gfo/Idh/MocA family oxidoreductase [Brachybacterium sp.]|uniref:Gfo/Idh/MocA family protein n=1 Tax=Brachybacterium sp. TaxID=1891286 RepID=UPI002ED47A31
MTSPLRLAVLGAWHVHAKDYARAADEHPGTALIAGWDDDGARGADLAAAHGVEATTDLDALLSRPDLDAVTVTTATRDHDAVIGAALAAGKHVFTEKLLSPTLAGCDALIRAAEEAADGSGVVLTVSLPRLAHGYARAVRELLDQQALGRLTYSRVRLSHNGAIGDWLPARFYDAEEALGGVFIDLGAHPMYLTQLILGTEFTSVTSTFTDVTGRGVEDGASVAVTTEDGAIGVIEASFVTGRSHFTLEIHGTEGSLLYGVGAPRLQRGTADGWRDVHLPPNDPHPFAQWIEAIRGGTRTPENLERARALTRLATAAYASER